MWFGHKFWQFLSNIVLFGIIFILFNLSDKILCFFPPLSWKANNFVLFESRFISKVIAVQRYLFIPFFSITFTIKCNCHKFVSKYIKTYFIRVFFYQFSIDIWNIFVRVRFHKFIHRIQSFPTFWLKLSPATSIRYFLDSLEIFPSFFSLLGKKLFAVRQNVVFWGEIFRFLRGNIQM